MAGGSPSTDASPCASLPGASPAGTLPKPHGRQPFGSSVRTVFPSPCGQLVGVPATAVCPGSGTGLPRRRCQPLAKRGGRRPWLAPERCPRDTLAVPPSADRSATALRRQGRSVARAAGPRHHRPRLRHEAHRRGDASAASRPPQARARVVTTVRLSAQPPADRSVQRLKQRAPLDCPRARLGCQATFRPPVGSATRSNRRCALPHLIAPQGAHKEGTGAAALCPCRWFLPPPIPLQGAPRIATAPGGQRLCRSCHWSSAVCSSLLASVWQCNAAGLLRQGLASRRAPAGRPPRSGRQRGQEGVSGGPRCWRTRHGRGLARTAWGQRAPTPLAVAALPGVGRVVFYWPGCVPRIGTPWKASHGRGGLAGGRSSGAAPLACLWPLRFSVLGRPRKVISARSCVKARPRSRSCAARSLDTRSAPIGFAA